jgi:YVTN family beta-propeller protein
MESSRGGSACPGVFRRLVTLKSLRPSIWLAFAAALVSFPAVLSAQNFTVSIAVAGTPGAIAVDPVTGQIYVANAGSGSVSVIAGSTEAVVATIPVGTTPTAIAVDSLTNTIYVANSGSGNVSVINGATNTVVATVTVGTSPSAIAVDPLASVVYVANSGTNNLSVIPEATNAVSATVPTGTNPVAVAVNPQKHMIYVANKGSGSVSVISGASNAVSATVAAGTNPVSVAVNPLTNQIYVANNGSNNVTLIAGATNATTTVADPNALGPVAVAVNSVTGNAYVANSASNNVTEIATGTNATTTITDPHATAPSAVAVNLTTNQIYVANGGSNDITAITGTSNVTTTLSDPGARNPAAIAVNPATHQVYAANAGSNSVSGFNGATNATTTLTDSRAVQPVAVAVNPVNHLVFVANSTSNNVTVLNGSLFGAPATVAGTIADPSAVDPVAVAVDPVTNQDYVANRNSNNVTLISTSGVITTITDPNAKAPVAVAVNPVTNKIYVANSTSNNVTVIDGVTNAVSTISDPNALGPAAIAVNPATGKVYVANSGSNNVSVFDPLNSTVLTITDPAANRPVAVVVNPVTDTVYVANFTSDNVSVINGATNQITMTIDADLNPIALDVNANTNLIYVANSGRNNVTVINGATLTVAATVGAGTAPHAIAVDPATNQIYVVNNGNGGSDPGSMTDIDGISLTSVTFSDPNASAPVALAIDPTTSQIYITNSSSGNVTDAAEQSIQVNEVSNFQGPVNQSSNVLATETPTFIYDSMSPANETLDASFYQLDSWSGAWTAAMPTGTASQYSAAVTSPLTPGFHLGYAFGTDGEEGTSPNTGPQSSPLIGNIAAYGFIVAPPIADPSPASMNFGTQTTHTASAAQTVKLANPSANPLAFTYAFTGTNASDFTEGPGDTCGTDGGQLPANSICTVSVVFTPSTNGSEGGGLTFSDNSNGISGSSQTVQLTGSGSAVPTFTLSVAEAGSGLGSVSSTPTGINCQPNCSSAFNQGASVTLTATPLAGSTFAGWSGACTGTGSCIVNMNSNQTVTATFNLIGTTACNASGATIWTGGGGNSNWSNASNWSTGAVPNSATVTVCISDGHAAAAVNLDVSAEAGTLVIDSGSSLTISNNLDLEIAGSLYNAGQLIVAANGNQTNLSASGAITVAGGGSILMNVGGNGGTPVIRQDTSGSTFTNVNNTISGRGQIGNGNVAFINQAGGTVNANSAGSTLLLNPSSAVNSGLFEASNQGVLQADVTINNAGGTITALSGSQVGFLNSADIQGGTLSTASGATFLGTTGNNTVVLDGSTHGALTNAGVYTIQNNGDTELIGSIINTGSFQIAANGNQTNLSMSGTVTLSGGGTVVMSVGGNGGTPVIRQDPASSSLINVNNTIAGVGQIGNGSLAVTNEANGKVEATGSALLINATQFTNQGLLEAAANGTLETDTLIVNAGGNLTATGTAAAVDLLNGTRIEGGQLNESNGAGFFGVISGNTAVLDGSTQGQLINTATFTIQNNADAEVLGTISNTGSFQVAANGNQTNLSASGPVTLTGGGLVAMTVGGNGGIPVIRQDSANSTLTNVNNTFAGAGQVGNGNLAFINQPGGVLNANSAGQTMLMNAVHPVNQGVFEATGGGIFEMNVVLNNAGGLITAAGSSQVQFVNGSDVQGGTLSSSSGAAFFGVVGSNGVVLDGSTQGPLNNAAAFTIANNGDAELIGTINNTGSFQIAANGNQTNLGASGAVTLTGGGSILMTIGGNGGTPVIRADVGGASFINVNNAISGAGQVGNGNVIFINEPGGTVDANLSGATLLFNAVNPVNQGLLKSANGGILQFDVTLNNSAGVITAGPGSQVLFSNGADIQGGLLSSDPAATNFGLIGSNEVVLDGSTRGPLTNQASFTIQNNADAEIFGTIVNTGSIQVAANGNQTNLSAIGLVTLTGGGLVSMTIGGNGGTPVIRQDSGGSLLTNVNNTFSGAGQVGNGNLVFVNDPAGKVIASISGKTLLFNPVNPVNQGILESTGGGILQFDVTVNNSGGTISAGPSSQVLFSNGADIQGGLLSSDPTATNFGLIGGNEVVLDGTTHGTLVNAAKFTVGNNGDTELMGAITNTGSIQVGANGNQTNLSMLGAVTLGGNGTVVMSIGGNGGTPVIRQNTGGSSLTNSGNSITGPGQMQLPVYMQTAGFIQIPTGISDSITTFSIGGGDAQIDGSLTVSGGVATSGAGVVSGAGTIASSVANGGITEGGDVPGAGKLTIGSSQTFVQSSAGAYEVALGGLTAGTYSQLAVGGSASLAGALNVRFVNGFAPSLGNSFTILTASSVSGTFSMINSPALPAGLAWSVAYNATSVVLTAGQGSPANSTLRITGTGTGSGTITDDLGQINCTVTSGVASGTCTGTYQNGAVAILSATPNAASNFTGWSTCAGTSTCNVTVSGTATEQVSFASIVPTFSISVTDLGTGTGSVTDNTGLIDCSEASGLVTGTCMASYPSGTQVTLTENASAPTTFGGWGNACASSAGAQTCVLTVSSALAVSANFVPPPTSINVTFNPGSNVTQMAAFDCPSNPNPTPANPCTDANAHALQLAIPTVGTGFTVTVTATEVPPTLADGLCETGNTVLNDFDCRFATFFNYGADSNGNTIVPLCYPYANGNCVHYDVYSGTPGTEPNSSFYGGGVNWKVTWNNDTFTPPSRYTGSTPQLYDDPDYAVTPTSAVGTVCTQPMTINGAPQSYACQFEFDITTFFNPTEPVDAGIGGTTKQLNDVVVAFPPNTAGQLNVTSTPDAATTNAGAPIGITIAVSNAGPGVEDNVALNDPLPAGTGVSWSISPAYSGPGTCAIAGAIGSQVLTCSFGTLESGANASLHITSASAGAGTYVNAATVTVNNQQFLSIATITVGQVAPVFSGLTPSQSISAGTAAVSLSGTLSATGPVYPASGETVSVTINGSAQPATIGANGAFTVAFPTSTIPASATPYTITYNYAGDANLTSVTNTSTTLTVNAVVGSVTLTITELGTGTGAVTDDAGKIDCSEANGIVTGTCSASYPTGTQVLLTANPTAPSTFGGWTNACAVDGTGASCGLTLTSSATATANFLPPPQNVTFNFNPGTNVTQQGIFSCPSNPNPTPTNPCTDSNAHTLGLQLPQVNTPFTITLTATEVPPNQGTGLCKPGDTVLNDFNCRFTTFFDYGLDGSGDTIVPLCYPYANGNCVHYAVYSGTPGTEPNPSFYTGPVAWTITWNNDTFVPTSFWAGSTPQLYDDPDYAATPTSAVGSVCTQPMTINGVAQIYSCQFEFDITTFFNPTAPVDAGIGGTTKQLNDVVVAFPPTTTGAGQLASTSTSSSTAPGSPISFTIAVSNAGPGTENSVTLNDPLPDVSSSNWIFSPAYSGPGTCSIGGAAGAQTLSCTFGNLAAGTSFRVEVTNPTPGAGTYTNTATITAANQQILSITSATISATTTSFSGLSPSPSIAFGTATVTLSGVISAPGPLYPPITEKVSVSINGSSQTAPIGANGTFSLAFPAATIPASATPYTITYSYAGDTQFASATNTATTLTVTPAGQTITFTGGPATAAYGSTFGVSATASSGLTVTITASGACTISGGRGSGTVTMTSGTGTCVVAANQAGNSNYAAASQQTSSTAALKASSTTTISSNSPNPATTGQAVAIAVKVTGTGTPTGSVQIKASTGETCTATVASGAGTCSITFTTAGPRTLQAVYSGDSNFNGSTSVGVTQTVNAAATSTLKISPSSVNFGNVYVGLLGIQFVTLTNSGATPISINKIAISGSGETPREFLALPLCPPTLAAKFSCIVLVTFIPSHDQTATQSASLVISDSAAGSPQSVPLSGTPINPQASLSPFVLNFAPQKVGSTSAAQTITVENTGTTPLTLGTISINGNFTLAAGTTCAKGGTVNPSTACIIHVAFAPKSKGRANGSVIVNDNALISPQVAILSGTGD